MKSRRQAFELFRNTAVVATIQIFNQFLPKVFYRNELLQINVCCPIFFDTSPFCQSVNALEKGHQKAPRLCGGAGILAIGRGRIIYYFFYRGIIIASFKEFFLKIRKNP